MTFPNHTTSDEDESIRLATKYVEENTSETVQPLLDIIERLDDMITKNGNDSNTVEEELRSAARENRSRIEELEAENKTLSEKIDEMAGGEQPWNDRL